MTSYPSILGGRVKTLHPKFWRNTKSPRQWKWCATNERIWHSQIDLVIVDLYPLKKQLPQAAKLISLKKWYWWYFFNCAAAKLQRYCNCSFSDQYSLLLDLITKNGDNNFRRKKIIATKAFHVSSHYDTAILIL
jgi:phosphoribosylaminoimidazolecarboxamide formyltransferase/IMP cyclohydrolase